MLFTWLSVNCEKAATPSVLWMVKFSFHVFTATNFTYSNYCEISTDGKTDDGSTPVFVENVEISKEFLGTLGAPFFISFCAPFFTSFRTPTHDFDASVKNKKFHAVNFLGRWNLAAVDEARLMRIASAAGFIWHAFPLLFFRRCLDTFPLICLLHTDYFWHPQCQWLKRPCFSC